MDKFFNQDSSAVSAECTGGGVKCFLKDHAEGFKPKCGNGKAFRLYIILFRQLAAAANDAFTGADVICPDDAVSKAAGCAFYLFALFIYVGIRVVSNRKPLKKDSTAPSTLKISFYTLCTSLISCQISTMKSVSLDPWSHRRSFNAPLFSLTIT